jgi:molybdate transport system substrate-binding protein
MVCQTARARAANIEERQTNIEPGSRSMFKTYTTRFPKVIFALCLLWGSDSLQAATLRVFAAASLTDSLKELGARFESRAGHRVTFSFGASSFLARQIEEGAPADIFFSADEAKMDALDSRGLILKSSRVSRLSNRLVIVVHKDRSVTVNTSADLAGSGIQRIALADPKTVPAGIYAREHLEKIGIWAAVRPKVVPTDNVRAALAAVEAGNVDAGFVYRTDVALSRQVRIAYEVPASVSPDIRYSMAVVKESRVREAAQAFLDYLRSEEAGRLFDQHGFIVLPLPHPRPSPSQGSTSP